MREATVKVYSASELTGKAKESALEWYRGLWDSSDADAITEMFKSRLEEAGLSELEPRWSLSYCQGDGVAFYGRVDLEELASKQPHVKALLVSESIADDRLEGFEMEVISISSHYSHWNTMRTSVIAPDGMEDLGGKLCETLDAILVDLSRQLEKEGYTEIEYLTGEERFLETAEANEWEFTENGELFR